MIKHIKYFLTGLALVVAFIVAIFVISYVVGEYPKICAEVIIGGFVAIIVCAGIYRVGKYFSESD